MSHAITSKPLNEYFTWVCSCGKEQPTEESVFDTREEAWTNGTLEHAFPAAINDEREKVTKLQNAINASVEQLKSAQGEWECVNSLYAPTHVLVYKEVVEDLESALLEVSG